MIRKAAASDPFQRALDNSTLYTGLYLQYAIQHVGDKFNKLNEKHAVWLRDRLGEAISQRKQYLTYVEEHRDRLMTAAESTVNLRLDGPALPAPVPDDARTKATTLKPAAPIISLDMIHDGSREAFDDDAKSETTMALTTDEGSKSIRLTRIMKLADVETSSQGEVQCPYCTYIGSFRSQKSWERHIYSDLKAYVCTYKECKEPLFSNKQAWFKHELDVHRSYYCCAVCAGQDRLTETTYIEHLQQHHPVLLEASPFSAILSISRVAPTSFRTNDCPLCSDYSYKYDFGQNRTLRQFRDHVANHLEQLALFALPNLATADDEDEEQEIDRSSPVADDSASEFDTHEEQDQQGIDSWLVTDSSPVQSYHMLEDSDHPPDVTIGGEHEAATANMENMENMGFARADIDAAMRDTSSDPDRAIELLLAVSHVGLHTYTASPNIISGSVMALIRIKHSLRERKHQKRCLLPPMLIQEKLLTKGKQRPQVPQRIKLIRDHI